MNRNEPLGTQVCVCHGFIHKPLISVFILDNMNSAHVPPASRKAGRSRACGPCHRRKVACDRSRPACGSCRRRRRKEPCEYEVEPSQHSTSLTPTPASSGAAQNSPRSLESYISRHVTPAAIENEPSTCFNSGAVNTRDSVPSGRLLELNLQLAGLGAYRRLATSVLPLFSAFMKKLAILLPFQIHPQLLSRTQRRNEFGQSHTTGRQTTSLSERY